MTYLRAFLIAFAAILALSPGVWAASGPNGSYGEQKLTITPQGRPAVVALIGGKGPYLFLLDTGSSQTILSEALLTTLGAEAKGGAQVTVTTASGSITSQLFRIRDVSTAGVTLEDLDVVKSPFPRALGADGVFGSDFLANFNVEMDWTTRKFRLYPSGVLPPLKDFRQARARLDKRAFLNMAGKCRNVRCNVILDTGGLISLGNRALGQQLPPAVDPQAAIDFLEVNGLQSSGVKAYAKVLTRLQIGGLSWSNRDVAIAELPVFDQLDEPSRPTLFLGLDILGKGHLVIDYDRAVIHLRRP